MAIVCSIPPAVDGQCNTLFFHYITILKYFFPIVCLDIPEELQLLLLKNFRLFSCDLDLVMI